MDCILSHDYRELLDLLAVYIAPGSETRIMSSSMSSSEKKLEDPADLISRFREFYIRG